MTVDELEQRMAALGQPSYRARQVMEWVYRHGAISFESISVLPLPLRRCLAPHLSIGRVAPVTVRTSQRDGTEKALYRYPGGRNVETVFIPEAQRGTLCLSTQAGCARACTFCATGCLGLKGSLSAAEIVNQYLSFPGHERITRLVYMGMGEPFDNTEAVLRSLERLTAEHAGGWSAAHITVSTVGVLPGMLQFIAHSKAHLALSLHNPFPGERLARMPVEASYPLQQVLDALRATWPRRGRRRLTIEITLQAGWNDTSRHARETARLLRGLPARINLLPCHTSPGSTAIQPSTPEVVAHFKAELLRHGFRVTLRHSRGEDIEAACGLLAARDSDATKACR